MAVNKRVTAYDGDTGELIYAQPNLTSNLVGLFDKVRMLLPNQQERVYPIDLPSYRTQGDNYRPDQIQMLMDLLNPRQQYQDYIRPRQNYINPNYQNFL